LFPSEFRSLWSKIVTIREGARAAGKRAAQSLDDEALICGVDVSGGGAGRFRVYVATQCAVPES
jgi:hypothetical protein